MNNFLYYLKNKKYLFSIITSFLFLLFSTVVTFFAIRYTTFVASNSVSDLILNNLRVFNVAPLFIYGPIIFIIVVAIYIFKKPETIPFVFESISLFYLIRSVFISLTHLGPLPNHVVITSTSWLSTFTTGNDFFFSGHTGLPFLLALIFWEDKPFRYFCLTASIFFGTIVLMGHLHYSIDVFGAFFITYTIYHLARKIFFKNYQLFQSKK